MATYYIDWEGGNDSNDGTSFANRKKTQHGFSGVSVTGGDEIRFAGKPRQLLDSSARIWNWFGWRPYSYQNIGNITYSQTTGETVLTWTGHGMQTGETVGIDMNSNFSNHWETINGIWEVTRVDANTFKLNDYTAPTGATTGSNGYIRKMKCGVIQLSSEVTKEIASNGQRSAPWTASTNVTCTLETSTGTWSSQVPMQSHAYSDKIEIADGFGTGKAAYWATTGTLDLSGYQQVSYLIQQKSGTRTSQGSGTFSSPNISLRLCTDTTGNNSVHTIPIVTGADTQTNWRDFTKDFGTNLNSSIQSIALYVDSDNGAQTFNFDNIIACKAKSAADSLTLNSVVGLGTQLNNPHYFKIGSIRKKNIRILMGNRRECYYPYAYYIPGGADLSGGVGIARTAYSYQTVNMYKIEPTQVVDDMGIEPGSSTWSSYSPNWFQMSSKSGISTTNRLKISGGWDVSNSMATQHTGGYSAINNHTCQNYFMEFSSCSYTDFSNFMAVSAMRPLYFSSCSYSSFHNIGATGAGYYGLQFQSCNQLLGGMYAWGNGGNQALYVSSCSNWNNYKEQNVGLTSVFGCITQSEGVVINYANNSDFDYVRGKQVSQSNTVYIAYTTGCRIERLEAGDCASGGGSVQGFRLYQNYGGITVGIATVANCYYGTYFENASDVVIDKLDLPVEDWSRENGSNGYSNNMQYGTYHRYNSTTKILGGTWDKYPYMTGSDILTDNVIFNFSGSPQFSQNNRLLCKNYDGSSGVYKNFYQHGTVEPDTSIRHTASGFSWKIDISSSTASFSSPIEWEVAKVICNANAQVTASIWVYRDGTGVNGGLRVKASAIEGVGSSNIDAYISDTTNNSWVQVSLNFTPTASGTVSIYAMGYIPSSGGSTSHNVWLDDFTVTQA